MLAMTAKPRQSFPNIVVKSTLELKLGRFVLVINEMEKVVYIRPTSGGAASQDERYALEKFLRYKRPDIINSKVATGWGIQFALDLVM